MTKWKIHHEALEIMKSLIERYPIDETAAAERWVEAETVVDNYMAAVEEKSADLPNKSELGEACFWLLCLVDLLRRDENWELVSSLLVPGCGVEMYAILPRVRKLKTEALVGLETMVKAEKKPDVEKDHPFEDLF
ncbi:MAG: hypothetical protein ACXIU5_05670 [Halomonadaceae bacterium]|jgi:hypothetical protein